jgi:hypothetical protein
MTSRYRGEPLTRHADERKGGEFGRAARAVSSRKLKASLKSVSPRFSARNPFFLARDNKICASALRYTKRRGKLALLEPACHETTYCSGFQLFGSLVYAVLPCGRLFGFDDNSEE